MDSKIIKPPSMYSGKIMTHWLNLILKSDQGLVLRQTQILRYTRYKNLQKQSNKDLFYTVTNPCPMHIEILKQAIILNPHTKLSFSSNDPYFYDIKRIKNITDRQTYHNQRLLQIYLQLGLIFPTQDLKRNWIVIPNDWKIKFRKETSQKSLVKIFFLTTVVLGK